MLPRHLPQEAPALEAEDAAPHSVEVHGNDRNIDALHDAFKSAPEGKQLPGARDLPLGEDADDLVVAQRVARRVQRMQTYSRGCCSLEIGIAFTIFANGLTTGGRKCPCT